MNIKEELLKLEDVSYRDFHSKLMPNIDKNRIIGIRVPRLRLFVKEHYFNIDKENFLMIYHIIIMKKIICISY